MSAEELWQAHNSAYLSAELARLRAALEARARALHPAAQPAEPAALVAALAAAPPQLRLRRFFGRPSSAGAPTADDALLLAPESESTSAPADARAPATPLAAGPDRPLPALELLEQRLGLSRFEREILLLCIAMELDTRMPELCALAQADARRAYPTFALALGLFPDPVWEALSPARPLRYWHLIEVHPASGAPLTTSALVADERIVHFAKGLSYLDARLAGLVTPLPPTRPEHLSAAGRASAEAILQAVAAASERSAPPPLIHLLGRERLGKRAVAAAACSALDLHPYRLSPELLPPHTGELETLARLWHRETRLLPLALYLDAHGADKPGEGESGLHPLTRFALRSGGMLFLDGRRGLAAPLAGALSVDVAPPAASEQCAAWRRELGTGAGDLPESLAGQFDLELAEIGELAGRGAEADAAQQSERLWQACRAQTRPALDELAQKLEPRADWADLVLPAPEAELLRQIAHRVQLRSVVYDSWGFRARMSRGLGVSALFVGESGTGKTLAAEVLANALQLDLYRIDLSAVVNKYIGETEKNLRRLFDAAERGGAILFFDEADALFGKRSEVRDSHDRYANIEVNYLLQRMEAFTGLAILASNMKRALDGAFLRRLSFVVQFPYPTPAERRQIWVRAFPPGVPLAGLDFDALARLDLTGGNIHSAALNAAFLAAHAQTDVSMALVLQAVRLELKKHDRPFDEGELRRARPAEDKRETATAHRAARA